MHQNRNRVSESQPCAAAAISHRLPRQLTPLSLTPETPQMAGLEAFLTYWYTNLPPAQTEAELLVSQHRRLWPIMHCNELGSQPPCICSRTWRLHDPSPVGRRVVRVAPGIQRRIALLESAV